MIEVRNTQNFVPFNFEYGIVVKMVELDIEKLNKSKKIIIFKDSIFKIVSDKKCLFYTKFFRGIVTPFPLKGVIVFTEDKYKMRAIIPLGSTTFILGAFLSISPYVIEPLLSLFLLQFFCRMAIPLLIFIIIVGLILYEIIIINTAIIQFENYIKNHCK